MYTGSANNGNVIHFYPVLRIEFVIARVRAENERPLIKQALCDITNIPEHVEYFLSADEKSGFVLVPNYGTADSGGFDLVSVFSSVYGRGSAIMECAESLGATTLDCFDGYLTNFYKSRGWIEYARETNWSGPNHPAVVFLTTQEV